MDVVLPDFIDNVHKTLSQSLKEEIKRKGKKNHEAMSFWLRSVSSLSAMPTIWQSLRLNCLPLGSFTSSSLLCSLSLLGLIFFTSAL